MSDVCNALTSNIASRKCLTPGGLKNKAWVFQQDDMTGAETFNPTTKALSSFGLKAGYTAITATARPRKSKGDNKLTKPEDGAVSAEQSLLMEFAYDDQVELDAIMDFLRAENKTVFVETNGGKIRQYFHEFGDSTLDGSDGTGVVISDTANIVSVTLKGTESNLPRFFEAVISGQLSQLASSRAYLDGLVEAAG
jgi:hypothetical protein